MSGDIISGGASGGVVAIFILGANWAKSLFNGKGNGDKYVTRVEYEARHQDIRESLRRIEEKVDRIRS